jgi:hypothetical protein
MKPLALFLALMMVSGVAVAQEDCGADREFGKYPTLTKFRNFQEFDQCRIANALEQLVAVMGEK